MLQMRPSHAAAPQILTRASLRYAGEAYDARLERPDWASCSMKNASSFAPACSWPWPSEVQLSASQVSQKRMESFRPVNTTEVPCPLADSTATVYDFGQNMAGIVTFHLTGTRDHGGSIVMVRHAELVFPNGSLWHHYPGQREQINYTVSISRLVSFVVAANTEVGAVEMPQRRNAEATLSRHPPTPLLRGYQHSPRMCTYHLVCVTDWRSRGYRDLLAHVHVHGLPVR